MDQYKRSSTDAISYAYFDKEIEKQGRIDEPNVCMDLAISGGREQNK